MRLTYHFGKVGLSQRQSKLFNLQKGDLPVGNVLKDQKVVIAVDGGRTRIRINKTGKRNSQTHRHGFTGEWIEREARAGQKLLSGRLRLNY